MQQLGDRVIGPVILSCLLHQFLFRQTLAAQLDQNHKHTAGVGAEVMGNHGIEGIVLQIEMLLEVVGYEIFPQCIGRRDDMQQGAFCAAVFLPEHHGVQQMLHQRPQLW